MQTRLSLVVAGLALTMASRIGFCQESSNSRELKISVPQESQVDDEAWRRISDGYEAEKSAFVRSLLELDASQIDYSCDSLADIQRKRETVSRAFGASAQTALEQMTNQALAVDYLRVAWEVVPRLTGRVVKVGKGQAYQTIAELLPDLKTGDRVDLDAGMYSLTVQNGTKLPSDVAFTGRGRQDTTLIFLGDRSPMNTVYLERWRFADVKIDTSANSPFRRSPRRQGEAADAGGPVPSGSIHLQRCEFTGVSRGALSGGTLLIEGCAFRGEKVPFGGELFEFLGPQSVSAVYLRNCEFENVRDFNLHRIVHEPIVLDRCRWIVPEESGRGGPPAAFYEAQIPFLQVLTRSSTGFNAPKKQTFEYAIDDAETVRYVLGQAKMADPRIIQLNDGLKLVRNPFFWIGLLRHSDDGIRREAAKQINRILSIEVVSPEPVARSSATTAEISAAIEALDSDTYAKREEARQKLIEIGEPAIEALRLIEVNGTLEQQRSAEHILKDRDLAIEAANLPQSWENEYGRISRWYAAERGKLTWDDAQGAYVAR